MIDQNKPPPYTRPYTAPAPTLTDNGRCSHCNVTAVSAGGHDLKVCPQCFALLWHEDWSAEERRRRQEATARTAAATAAATRTRRENQQVRQQEARRKLAKLETKKDEPL